MAKKDTKASKPGKIPTTTKVRSKGEVYRTIAEQTGLSRKQLAQVFDTMASMIAMDLKGKVGVFAVPGMMKITVQRKPATKGGQRPNPFKPGEMMEVKPKPARNVIKVRALKALKSMV